MQLSCQTKGRYQYLFVTINIFSGRFWVFPTKRNTATVTVKILLKIVHRYGTAADVGWDEGGGFVSEATRVLMSNLGIKQRLPIPYHLQSSRLIERMSQTIKNRLKIIVGRCPKWWAEKLPLILVEKKQWHIRDWFTTLPYFVCLAYSLVNCGQDSETLGQDEKEIKAQRQHGKTRKKNKIHT